MITVDFKRLNVKPGYRILDIGCGNGRHTGAASDLKETMTVGADLKFKDLKIAAERLKWHDGMLNYRSGSWSLSAADITALPFADQSFDLVICSEVLEHIPDDQRAMHEILRVLKPGHDLVVSVPRYWPEQICWALSVQYRNAEGGHIRIYSRRQLEALIGRNGAAVWASHFAHALHTPYWWLKCLTGVNRDDISLIKLYHRFLTWDLMQKPLMTRWLERCLNPMIGKSLVLYVRKPPVGSSSNPIQL